MDQLDRHAALGGFLRSRRARLRPEDVGLPPKGHAGQGAELRCEELAQLAEVSTTYYSRLEQGYGRIVSAEVLDAIARALRLTNAEHTYLRHLAEMTFTQCRMSQPQEVRPTVWQFIDSMDKVSALVLGRRLDILAWNRLTSVLIKDFATLPPTERNMARLIFLDPEAQELYLDWEAKAAETVNALRIYADHHAHDRQLHSLVGELSVKSNDFRRLWAAHTTAEKSHGSRHMHHPLVGDLILSYETLRLPDDHDQSIVTYHAKPGSASADTLSMLASWTAGEAVDPGTGMQ
ncbi:helix-turn-helix transcriptional regulator [Streptomyces sp. NPDC007901]|uniref:helix-turn-helix transcriptional regulator n=1 Tax=Streptomyces sp. NPDC007901 TaxID=3364785 RepID=UPI0036E5F61D